MPQSVEGVSGATAGDGEGAATRTGAEVGTGRRRRAPAAPEQVRGGHPEQPEWSAPAPERYGTWQGVQARPQVPGPRREFVEAFGTSGRRKDAGGGQDPRTGQDARTGQDSRAGQAGPEEKHGRATAAPAASATLTVPVAPDVPDGSESTAGPGVPADGGAAGSEKAGSEKGSKGRTFTGIAAAAVTTVLAVVVAGQVADGGGSHDTSRAAGATERETGAGPASRGDNRPEPKAAVVPLTYAKKMSTLYPLDPKLEATGKFSVVPGSAKAPGTGRKYRYRVDIEKGMGLDGMLFAEAVQKTLNDNRSWAHDGAKTFERISSGQPDFVITLASPVTTAKWCEKSGLDTLEENVSCDSAATDRVMINAYRWAQGSETFGDSKIYPYRQMLINHEVGHRLGHNHESCRTPGALAPVMQQQTKSLDIDGIRCRANPWVYPTR